MLAARNVKAATIFMAKAIEEFERRQAEQQRMLVAEQSQQQAALSQQQEENKRNTLAFEYKLKMDFEAQKNRLETEKMKEAHKLGISAKAFEIEAGQNATS
jgi:hypothetical protein